MTRFKTMAIGIAAIAAAQLCGCAASHTESTEAAGRPAPRESMAAEDTPNSAPANLRVVMQAKTAWASSLLEAISSRDYRHVESNAEALRKLSLESGFLAQDTLAYRTLADEFRQEVSILAQRARDRDQPGVETSYHRVTAACFRCHEYVSSERYQNSMPGRSGM